jgi:uracil-DNA glycosylase family 4
MLVGEQSGGQEDQAGQPFVGPAGKLLGQTNRIPRASEMFLAT